MMKRSDRKGKYSMHTVATYINNLVKLRDNSRELNKEVIK